MSRREGRRQGGRLFFFFLPFPSMLPSQHFRTRVSRLSSSRFPPSTTSSVSSEHGASLQRCRATRNRSDRRKVNNERTVAARHATCPPIVLPAQPLPFSLPTPSFLHTLSSFTLTLPHPLDTGRHQVGPVLEERINLPAHGALGGVDVEGGLHGRGVDRRQRERGRAGGGRAGLEAALLLLFSSPACQVAGEDRDAVAGRHLLPERGGGERKRERRGKKRE